MSLYNDDELVLLVLAVEADLKKLGIDAEVIYSPKNYRWKIVFLSDHDINLYKLSGTHYGNRKFVIAKKVGPYAFTKRKAKR